MNHSHGHARAAGESSRSPESHKVANTIWSAVGMIAVVTVIGLVAFWPHGGSAGSSDPDFFSDPPVKAQVLDVTTAPCTGTTEQDNTPCEFIRLHLDGQDAPTRASRADQAK
ncbi:MAG: hypothetical protein ABI862_16220 [Ilumatobacteraceae bacterium]